MDNFRQAMFIHLRAQLEALISEREGMLAANLERQRRGEALAYQESAFTELANQMRCVIPDPHQFE